MYTFVAHPGYRVRLTFDVFSLTGTATNCFMDYVDVYGQARSPGDQLWRYIYDARYCGTVSPRERISLYHVLILVFHTKHNSPGDIGFKGKFSFIEEDQFSVGIRQGGPYDCAFVIKSDKHGKSGVIFSPTYPGTYPQNFSCWYRFVGAPNQRVHIKFSDFDLYFGGEHCPYDSVTIYDGEDETKPIIRKLCGMQQKIDMFSRGNIIFVLFRASMPPQAEHRGFQIDYEFSEHFVNVDQMLVGESGVSHMRGTECDIRVLSNKETTHWIRSPAYPALYPANTTCTYIIDGYQGSQDLEKVILTFDQFNVPNIDPECSFEHGSFLLIGNDLPRSDESLPDNYDQLLCSPPLNHQEMPRATAVYLSSAGDQHAKELTLQSNNPRLILIFQSHNTAHLPLASMHQYGFHAKIQFKTDFGIQGEFVGDGTQCEFRFDNSKYKIPKTLNSPRYPSNYPLNTACVYHLIGRPGERVRLFFAQFTLSKIDGNDCGDYIEIFDMFEEHVPGEGKQWVPKLLKRYCPREFPGTTVSRPGSHYMKLVFHSDKEFSDTGFKVEFDFARQPPHPVPGEVRPGLTGCGGHISDAISGSIQTPRQAYDKDWVCVWEIKVQNGHRIMLSPPATNDDFQLEGILHQDPTFNNGLFGECQNTVLRIYANVNDLTNFTHELCGDKFEVVPAIYSNGNVMRVAFLTSPLKVNSLAGFKMHWTRFRGTDDGQPIICNSNVAHREFECEQSHMCIAEELKCNKMRNCKPGDNSDELKCEQAAQSSTYRFVGPAILAVVAVTFILLLFILMCVLLRRKARISKQQAAHQHAHRHAVVAKAAALTLAVDQPEPRYKRGHMNVLTEAPNFIFA